MENGVHGDVFFWVHGGWVRKNRRTYYTTLAELTLTVVSARCRSRCAFWRAYPLFFPTF